MAARSTQKDSQDSPWKRILQQYLREAVEFFFPTIAAVVDWKVAPVFLDKEFGKLAPEAKVGKRYADQLVQLKQKSGPSLVLLLHIEIQASSETAFAERMFIYAIRIFEYFRQPAISVAILCDANPRWHPQDYRFSLPETRLTFEFGTVKLLDYRDRWPELAQNSNPFAWVVQTHLKMLDTKDDPIARKVGKMQLIRQLYESGYAKTDIINLFHFIDWLLKLPKPLEIEFWQELQTYEAARKMTYISSVERIGYDRGKAEGKREGKAEGKREGKAEGKREGKAEGALQQARSLVIRLLERRFGKLPDLIVQPLQNLTIAQLEALGEALLDFSRIDDCVQWLNDQQ
jgi:Domain of unknown function (DUF4351)